MPRSKQEGARFSFAPCAQAFIQASTDPTTLLVDSATSHLMRIEHNQIRYRVIQILVGVIAMITLVAALWGSGRVALSRMMVKYAETVGDPAAADTAVGLTPSDAEAHYARAALSNYLNQQAAALNELELAVSLRPRDYYLWLELGLTRDELGDPAGALFCLNESVRLAPYYAQPRWQRGNLFFRMGRYDEAFADLRQAATSNPDLLPNFIDLAWGASRKDAQVTEQLVQVQSEKAHFALALFFAQHGKADEALAHFRSAGNISTENRRDLLRELLAAGALQQAFEIWSHASGNSLVAPGTVYDGGFEGSLNLDESGFGWRLGRTESGLNFSLDTVEPASGSRSLRIDFNGNPNPGGRLLSQLILVEPAIHYKLSFGVRTRNIVTGGPLVVTVNDAGPQRLLASSTRLPADTGGWLTFSVEFATSPSTRAIVVSLQRESCTTSPCPIFGSVNLDNFSLEQVKGPLVKG